jgi:LEA14-like dessication related protein
MTLKKGLILAGIGSLVVGIALWVKYQMELSYKLIYNTKNPKLKKFTATEVVVEFDFTIENPTELKVGINGMDIDVYANGVKVTNIYSQVPVRLEANSTASLPLKLSLNPQSLIQNTGVLLSTGTDINKVVLTMKGVLKIKKFGIPLPIPFVYTATYGELMA